MDILGCVNIPSWGISISIILITLYLYSKWNHSLWKRLGVPGPEPVLYMGILTSYIKKGIAGTDLELVQKYGDVIGVYQGHQPMLLVSDPEMVKEIFIKEFSNFTNRPLPVKLKKRVSFAVSVARDVYWKYLRSTLSPTFTSGKLKLMVPKIHKCCEALVDNIELQSQSHESIDMKELCGAFTMDVIASTSFGIQVDSQKDPNNRFVHFAKEAALGALAGPMMMLIMMFPFTKNWITLDLIKPEVIDFFKSAIRSAVELREDQKEEYHDTLQLMLDARHSGVPSDTSSKNELQEYKDRGLKSEEIEANSLTFFIAGYDTTANTLSFACYCLATNPEIQDKVFEEIDTVLTEDKPQFDNIAKLQYLDRFFNEVLRLHGAAIRFNRECREDIKIKNVFIPKGTDVSVPVYALHRNPKYWPDPETFDPDRFMEENKAKRPEGSFVPFGMGPRMCIGMRLALIEAKMALVFMVQNFTFSTCEKTEIPLPLDTGVILKAKNGILLKVNKRTTSVA